MGVLGNEEMRQIDLMSQLLNFIIKIVDLKGLYVTDQDPI